MSLYFFAIPALESDDAAAQLREFCQRVRVLSIERQLVVEGQRQRQHRLSFWLELNRCAAVPALDQIFHPVSRVLPRATEVQGAGRVSSRVDAQRKPAQWPISQVPAP